MLKTGRRLDNTNARSKLTNKLFHRCNSRVGKTNEKAMMNEHR